MNLNSALVVFADTNPADVLRSYPVLDKPATHTVVEKLFPGVLLEEVGDQLLADALHPADDVVYVGCYQGVDLICSWRLIPDRPSQVDPSVLDASGRRHTYLHAMHADARWCMYGVWRDGELVRALSAGRDVGVIEEAGDRLNFEQDFFDEEALDELRLGDAALRGLFGIVLDADSNIDQADPELIPVVGYRIIEPADPSL